MNTKIIIKLISIISFSLLFSCKSTKSLTNIQTSSKLQINKEWLSVMNSGIQPLKEKWTELLASSGWEWTKYYQTELTAEDFKTAELTPSPAYTLDSVAFMNLTKDSNIESLLKLDTTQATYYIFNKNTNKYVASGYGKRKDDTWKNNGYGGIDTECLAIANKVLFQKDFLAGLYVSLFPNSHPDLTFGLLIFYENGQLMAVRPMLKVKTLKEALIEFREYWLQARENNEIW